ncbi:MAG: hypothetical protein ABI237_08285 [Ginsengibacter sp.]
MNDTSYICDSSSIRHFSKIKLYSLMVALLLICAGADAQDFSNLKTQKPVSFHGSIGGGMNFYSSNETYQTRDPFSWNLYGSFAPAFYGFSLPFSFTVTQYSKSYTVPFTQLGISPTYKWIKLHLGYRSMSFSPMVFDGQSFLGGGIELNPKKFYFGAFYGRLNKAVSEDTTFGHTLQPQYGRTGYGVKIGINGNLQRFSLQFFHAKDDTGSIQRFHDSITTLLPEENTVLGSSWTFTFFKRILFSGDAAVSLLNRDLSYDNLDSIANVKIPHIVRSITPINYSSVVSFSGQAQLFLMLNNFNAALGYRRVQPDFKSLGVPYMLDDIEMMNGSFGTSFLKGKVSINGAYNTQHNNLAHMLSSQIQTRTGNVGLNAFVSQHLNINMNVTGVQIYQKDGLLKLSDSIRMNQLMLTGVFSPTLNFSNALHQNTINVSIAYTDLDDRNPVTKGQTNGNNLCGSLNYGLFFVKSYFGINLNLTYSVYGQQSNQYKSMGLNIGGNAQFLKDHNLNIQVSAGYFLNHATNLETENNTTFSFNGSYAVHRHHSLGIYANYILTPPVNLNPINEINRVPYAVNSKCLAGGITYAYTF